MQKKILKTTLIVALVLLAGVSIAYAALSTTLNITFGKVTQNALTWNVGFTGTEATGETGGTSGTGRSCGKATITASAITLADTTLSKPGDKCTYTFTIKNSGTVGAKLNTITPTAPTSITCGIATGGTLECGNITYKWDLLGEKDSPADARNKIYQFLLKYKIKYDAEEHREFLKQINNKVN